MSNEAQGPFLGTVLVATVPVEGGAAQYLDQPSSSGGGGGGASTIADGADVAEGAKADGAYASSDGSAVGTVVGILKGIFVKLYNLMLPATASSVLTADGAIAGAAASRVLMGYSVRNTDPDAAASCKVINGTGTGDAELAYVTLAPNESTREWFGPSGVGAASGLYLDEVTGAVSFVGWYK